MKILFQGDSITDGGRDRSDPHNLGNGYPKYAAEYLREKFPDVEFEFINLGIAGEQTKDIVARIKTDIIDVDADVVSILVGINDIWWHIGERQWVTDDVFAERYRAILKAIKKNGARLMVIEPYLLPAYDKLFMRGELDKKIHIIRRLSREYADVYLPADGLLASAVVKSSLESISEDGVHPTNMGAELLGKFYVEYISPVIEGLIK